jgi:hypothetical protein
MKLHLLIILSFITVSITVTAQDLQPNIFGIRGGLNLSSVLSDKISNFDYTESTKTGFNFGLSYQRLLVESKPFYFETGLYLLSKGFKQDFYYSFISDDGRDRLIEYIDNYKTGLLYIQIPFLLNYHFRVTDNIRIEPFAGLYTGYGINGKTKLFNIYEGYYGGVPFSSVVEDAFENDNFNKFDMGFKIGVGATFCNIYVGIEYELGLLNMGGKYYEGFSIRNRNLAIKLGYNISLSKNKKNKFNRIYPNAE